MAGPVFLPLFAVLVALQGRDTHARLAAHDQAPQGPCDIYAQEKTPCVAAHSMTRALYSAYAGPLYNVMKMPEHISKDVYVKSAGGVADAASQDAFCGKSTCIVQRIYDQSPMQNHLGIENGASNLKPPRNIQDIGVNFTDARSKATLAGHSVYGAFFGGDPRGSGRPFLGQGYSNRTAHGTAQGDEPESMYAVFGGQHFKGGCCFDYGNAENVTNGRLGPMFDGAMEAIYWEKGHLGADLEHGIYGAQPPAVTGFVAGFLKGKHGHYNIKAGDAQHAGSLKTSHDGARPKGYETMKKQGAIVLGIGGDNSPWGAGIFYEGAMTAGYASDETDASVMTNIVAAAYGKFQQAFTV